VSSGQFRLGDLSIPELLGERRHLRA
jgi:hypothetical protein